MMKEHKMMAMHDASGKAIKGAVTKPGAGSSGIKNSVALPGSSKEGMHAPIKGAVTKQS